MQDARYLPRSVKKRWKPHGRRLNVACGGNYLEGWHNVDFSGDHIDERLNLLEFPWPFADNSVDAILCSHYLEHIPITADGNVRDPLQLTLGEFSRILKPGGQLLIRVPLGLAGAESHLHYRLFMPGEFDFLRFTDGKSPGYGYPALELRLIAEGAGRRRIKFGKWFDSTFHPAKYLWDVNLGRGIEILYLFTKASPGPAGGRPDG